MGDRDLNTLTSLHDLAFVLSEDRQDEKAEALYERALEGRRAVLGPDYPDTQKTAYNLARVSSRLGRHEKAIALASELADLRRSKLGPDASDTIEMIDFLCSCQSEVGRNADAIQLRQSCQAACASLGETHPIRLRMANNLALAYLNGGHRDLAIKVSEEMLPLQEAAFGRDHDNTLSALHTLSLAYVKVGRLNDAEARQEEILAKRTAKLGREHPQTVSDLENLSVTYATDKKPERAIPLNLEHLKLKRKQVKDEWEFSTLQASVSLELLAFDAYVEAEPHLRECLATRTRLRPDDWRTLNTQSMLGGALAGLKRLDEAEPLLLAGYQGMKERQQQIPPEPIDARMQVPRAAERLAKFYEAKGQADKAAQWREVAASEQPTQ